MKILFHNADPTTIYAGRTIYVGYKNAFTDLGHKFYTLNPSDDPKKMLEEIKPDIFITSIHDDNLKQLDLEYLKKYRKRTGMKMFSWISLWDSMTPDYQDNPSLNLKNTPQKIKLIKNGLLGDIFFMQTEQDDPRMKGFTQATGKKFETILLAADKMINFPEFNKRYEADISFVGTNQKEKRVYFNEKLFPLGKKYKLRVYGQNWKKSDKIIGLLNTIGKKTHLNFLSKLKKQSLRLEEERRIYSSSKICVNIHTNNQVAFGMDINERFFKILACKSLQVTDHLKAMERYFSDKEVVYAKDNKEWFEKIDYYMEHPKERKKMIDRAYKKVLEEHTYHNRVKQIIKLAKKKINAY